MFCYHVFICLFWLCNALYADLSCKIVRIWFDVQDQVYYVPEAVSVSHKTWHYKSGHWDWEGISSLAPHQLCFVYVTGLSTTLVMCCLRWVSCMPLFYILAYWHPVNMCCYMAILYSGERLSSVWLMLCNVIKWHPFWAEKNVISWVDKLSANTSSLWVVPLSVYKKYTMLITKPNVYIILITVHAVMF